METINRISDPTPPYWRKVQWVFGVIAVVLGACWPILQTMPDITPIFQKIVEMGLAVSLAIVGMAQFTSTKK